MNFKEAKMTLMHQAAIGEEFTHIELYNAACVVYGYIKSLYGITHIADSCHHTQEGKREYATQVLKRLSDAEEAIPNIAKFGMDYRTAMAGSSWLKCPASIRDFCAASSDED